jgi:hypothetical protein
MVYTAETVILEWPACTIPGCTAKVKPAQPAVDPFAPVQPA